MESVTCYLLRVRFGALLVMPWVFAVCCCVAYYFGMSEEITRKVGRPPEPVPEHKARELLAHIAEGGTLARWCKQANVSPSTVRKWGKKDESFGEDMRDARATAVQQMEADTLRIADECEPADVAVARLRCDVRRWAVSRWQGSVDSNKASNVGAVVVVATGVPRVGSQSTLKVEALGNAKETDPGGGRPSASDGATGEEEPHIPPTHTSIPPHTSPHPIIASLQSQTDPE